MTGVHIINTPLVKSPRPKGARFQIYSLRGGGCGLQTQEPVLLTTTLRQPPQFWPSGHRCQACFFWPINTDYIFISIAGFEGALGERPCAYETKLGVVAWKHWLGIGCGRPPRCGGIANRIQHVLHKKCQPERAICSLRQIIPQQCHARRALPRTLFWSTLSSARPEAAEAATTPTVGSTCRQPATCPTGCKAAGFSQRWAASAMKRRRPGAVAVVAAGATCGWTRPAPAGRPSPRHRPLRVLSRRTSKKRAPTASTILRTNAPKARPPPTWLLSRGARRPTAAPWALPAECQCRATSACPRPTARPRASAAAAAAARSSSPVPSLLSPPGAASTSRRHWPRARRRAHCVFPNQFRGILHFGQRHPPPPHQEVPSHPSRILLLNQCLSPLQITRPPTGFMLAPHGRSGARIQSIRRWNWRKSFCSTCISRGTAGTRWPGCSTSPRGKSRSGSRTAG
ncbi:hypothetical protein LEMLEM_LOCUS11825 [Lemmus lemmus]